MKKLFLLLLCVPLLCGCSLITLERQIFPICLSLDVDENGRFLVGIQAPKSTNSDAATYELITASGETLDEALRVLSASTPYPLNFSQIRLCVMGYRLAATRALRPMLRLLLELPSMRPTAYVSVALGQAVEVLGRQKPDFGLRLSTHLSLLITRAKRERLLPDSTLAFLVRDLGDGRSDSVIGICAVNPRLISEEGAQETSVMGEPWDDALLPEGIVAGLIPHTSENPVEYLGAAAVSNDRVSGVLTADETQLLLWLLDEADLRAAREGERLQLQIGLDETSPLMDSQEAVLALMSKLQTLRADALTFGRACSMDFLTDAAWEAYDFDSRYAAAEVWVGAR